MQEIYKELITDNGTLRGFLHKPDKDENVPLVILYHGFTGSKNSNNFLFVQFARFLAKKGIAALRFDFTGTGDSDKDFHTMTFSKELFEANKILDYAKTLPFVKYIVVLGLSMGGVIATQLCKSRIDDIDKLILWSPAGNMRGYAKKADELAPVLENGNYELGGIELGRKFVDELKTKNLFSGIEVYDKPVAIFHGTEDEQVPIRIANKYKEKYINCELHIIQNGDHTFNSVLIRKELFDMSAKFILNSY